MKFTEQKDFDTMSDLKYKYHELIAINSNIKLTLIREARKN